jgi:hypothetical protein
LGIRHFGPNAHATVHVSSRSPPEQLRGFSDPTTNPLRFATGVSGAARDRRANVLPHVYLFVY